MHALFRLFLDVLLRRRGPEDVPASWALAGVVSLVALATNAIYVAQAIPDGHWAVRTLADFGVGAGYLALILLLARQLPRFLQSFTALTGAGVLVNFAGLGLLGLKSFRWTPLDKPIFVIFLALAVAALMVTEYVFRRTLECSPWRSVPLAIANLLLAMAVSQWLDSVFRSA